MSAQAQQKKYILSESQGVEWPIMQGDAAGEEGSEINWSFSEETGSGRSLSALSMYTESFHSDPLPTLDTSPRRSCLRCQCVVC